MEDKQKKKIKNIIGAIILLFIVLFTIAFPIYLNNGYKDKTIEHENWGCRIILPDGWEGKCDYYIDEDGIFAYFRKSRILESAEYKSGKLFTINRWDGVYTEKQVEEELALAPNIYLGTNNGYTYIITCASGVETNLFSKEYNQLYQEIEKIKIEFD